MKQTKLLVLMLISVLLVSVSFTACDDDDSDGSSYKTTTEIDGVWEIKYSANLADGESEPAATAQKLYYPNDMTLIDMDGKGPNGEEYGQHDGTKMDYELVGLPVHAYVQIQDLAFNAYIKVTENSTLLSSYMADQTSATPYIFNVLQTVYQAGGMNEMTAIGTAQAKAVVKGVDGSYDNSIPGLSAAVPVPPKDSAYGLEIAPGIIIDEAADSLIVFGFLGITMDYTLSEDGKTLAIILNTDSDGDGQAESRIYMSLAKVEDASFVNSATKNGQSSLMVQSVIMPNYFQSMPNGIQTDIQTIVGGMAQSGLY